MKLDCKDVWEYISEYIDQQLEPSVLADVENHLENCEVCSAVLDSTRNVLVLTADDRTFELPVGFSERLHRRLTEVIQEETGPAR
jgi:predicted anti-sigma-YlaC factor YlaD